MPNEDSPAIFAAIDNHALSQPILTEEQRTKALDAIALVRELSPSFLDRAEQIIKDDTTNSTELFNVSMTGARVSSAVVVTLNTLWVMEDAVFQARKEGIDVQTVPSH
jgi:hypothetical protein